MKDKKILLIIVSITIIFTILGGTLAYWSWSSTNAQKTMVTFTVTANMSCSADGGGSITNETMIAPAKCTDTEYALIRPITVNTTANTANEIIHMNMSLHVDSIAQELLDSDNFKYAITTSSNSCAGPIDGGSFKDKLDLTTQNVPLLTDEEFVGTETKTYYLYIWLDEAETDLSTMSKSFTMSLTGECSDTGNVFKKAYAYFGGSAQYFKNSVYKDNITSVSFVNEVNIPANSIINWDVGTNPSNATDVKAWLEDDGQGNNTFALKIGATDGNLYATNLSNAFYNMTHVSSLDFNLLNTSEVTDMSRMFFNVGSDIINFNVNLDDNFDTLNVVNMSRMFAGVGENSTNFNLNLSNSFNTSNVTDMSYMFSEVGMNATNWSLNLGNNFNTSKATTMNMMFRLCGYNNTSFSLNLGNKFDTSNVTDMGEMFSKIGYHSTNFNIDFGEVFDTSKTRLMGSMFSGAGYNSTNFKLQLGNYFNTSNVTTMMSMFADAGHDATNWSLNLGNHFDTSNVQRMQVMFINAGKNATNFSIDIGNKFNMSKITVTREMFANMGNSTLEQFALDLSPGNFANVTDSFNMFTGFPTSKATIYVKDATARSFIITQNNGFSASNVLIK